MSILSESNKIMLTDAYNLSHFFLKENQDWEISLLFNRVRPMILNGFSQVVYDLTDKPITHDNVIEAEVMAKNMSMPFPSKMWWNIVDDMKGILPIRIESLMDGTYVPKNTPFAKVRNTVKGFGELATWFESILLHTSFDSGCATRAFNIRRYLEKNKLPLNRIHSFGFRGHNSMENAIKAGKAWRLFLNGTDDFHTQSLTDGKGCSIPATAHKTIQQFDNELQGYYYSINQTKVNGFNTVVLVIDTYDPIRFIKFYAKKLADHAKSIGVHLVFRPDSGNVVDQAHSLYCMMWSAGLVKDTSCIIGEGITLDKIIQCDIHLKELGCELNWINYGMGSGFYKDIDRDYLGFAMKTSYSNGGNRMKFSADKIKESIPGDPIVSLNNGEMSISYNTDKHSEYVMLCNGNMTYMPYDWEFIKIRVSRYINDTLQYEIITCDDIINEKERLRKKYVTDVKVSY